MDTPTCWTFVRNGDTALEASDFVQVSRAITSALPDKGSATLLIVRDDQSLRQYLLSPSEALARAVATPIGAEPRPCDLDTHDLAVRHVAHMRMPRRSTDIVMTRANVVGVDATLTAGTLTWQMDPGTWIAVRMRRGTRRERRRQLTWVRHYLDSSASTHYSTREGSIVVSVDVGAPDRASAAELIDRVHTAIPGFDLPVIADQPTWWPHVLTGTLAGALAAGASWSLTSWPAFVTPLLFAAGLVVGIACGVSAWRGRAWAPGDVMRLITQTPPKRTSPPRAPTRADPVAGVVGSPGDYPLAPTSFLVAPDMIVGLVAPQAGAVTGTTQTRDRPVPPPFTEQVGPLIGYGQRGAPVHLEAASGWEDLLILGQAGSGKTVLTQGLFAWNLMERMYPSAIPGTPGRANALVAFENKGEGVDGYVSWATALGASGDAGLRVIDLADPATPAIDMVEADGSCVERAQHFVDAMQYSFTGDSIQYRSAETLRAVIAAGLVITPSMGQAATVPAGGSFLDYAYVLLGGLGDTAAVALAGELQSEAVRLESAGTSDTDLSAARDIIAPLYGPGVTPSTRRALLEAPRNKVELLRQVRTWWDPERPRISWESILTEHAVVVVNMGSSRTGQIVDGQLAQTLSAMLAFGLRRSIQRTCNGWWDAKRNVTIFADELKLLAGVSPEVFEWMRNQGRAFGVRLVFATQYAEQIDPALRTAILGFGTLVALKQANPEVAASLAQNLSLSGDQWSPQDLYNLPAYTAVVRSSVGGQSLPAFTVHLWNAEADRARFPLIQRDPALQVTTLDAAVSDAHRLRLDTPAPRATVFGVEV